MSSESYEIYYDVHEIVPKLLSEKSDVRVLYCTVHTYKALRVSTFRSYVSFLKLVGQWPPF